MCFCHNNLRWTSPVGKHRAIWYHHNNLVRLQYYACMVEVRITYTIPKGTIITHVLFTHMHTDILLWRSEWGPSYWIYLNNKSYLKSKIVIIMWRHREHLFSCFILGIFMAQNELVFCRHKVRKEFIKFLHVLLYLKSRKKDAVKCMSLAKL